jgi:hypothetical protein
MAAVTPWNFPFAIPMWLIASALVEGNSVVSSQRRSPRPWPSGCGDVGPGRTAYPGA